MANEKFNFVSAMNIINDVENSTDKGKLEILKTRLEKDVFKKMAVLGYIRGGFYIKNGVIVETYAVTRNYTKMTRILSARAKMRKIFPWLQP